MNVKAKTKPLKVLAMREVDGMTMILACNTGKGEYYLDLGRGRIQICFDKLELDNLAAMLDEWRSKSA